jgi:transcriptional regulator with XRE-family HTH domain
MNMYELTDDFYKQLGHLIQKMRKEKSLTQEAVADSLNISRATFANLEAGEHRILLHHILELASMLMLDLSEVANLYNQSKLTGKIASAPESFREAFNRVRSNLVEMRTDEATI